MNQQVRVVTLNRAPWFVANDVCRALDYKVTTDGQVNVTAATRSLDTDEVIFTQIKYGMKPMKALSRSGLNKLIMRSNKPIAKKFQDWLARDVIPAIQDGNVKAIMRIVEGAAGVA